GYPPALIDAILGGLDAPIRAADVGAGTGISARALAQRGVEVVAVEPNAAMRAAAAPHPRVTWREGTADDTGLPDGAVDLVLVAQAFHWFDPPGALREFHRILRPGGRLAIGLEPPQPDRSVHPRLPRRAGGDRRRSAGRAQHVRPRGG